MRELVVNTLLTLNGAMQAPGGPEEDPAAASSTAAGRSRIGTSRCRRLLQRPVTRRQWVAVAAKKNGHALRAAITLKNRASAWRKSRSRDAQPLGVRSRKAASALVAGPPQTSSRTSSHSRRIRRPRTAPRATLLPLTRRTRAPNGRLRNRRSQVRILSGALRRPCLRGLFAFRAPSRRRVRPDFVPWGARHAVAACWSGVRSRLPARGRSWAGLVRQVPPARRPPAPAAHRPGVDLGGPPGRRLLHQAHRAGRAARAPRRRARAVGPRLAAGRRDVRGGGEGRTVLSARAKSRTKGRRRPPAARGFGPHQTLVYVAAAHMATHTPVCGRDAECAVLDGLLDAVRRGESRALVVEQP